MHIIRELLSVLAQAGDGLSGPRSQRQLEPASASVRAESAPARQRRIAGGLLCLLAMLAGPAMAADWYASPSGAGTQDCMSAANACKGIQAAINKAGTYDTVHVAQGNYAFTNDRVVINTEGLKLIGDSSPFAAPYGSGAGQVAPGTLGNKAANASVLKAASAAAASGGASGMIWVRNVKNVRIENLYVEVDSSGSFDFSCFCTIVKAKEAIVASGTVNGLQLVNNYIKITGGTGAIAIGINVLATSDSSVPASEARQSGQFVTIDGNVIEPTSSPAAAPKRAIAMENQVGLIARNQLAGTTQDLWVQYANASGSAPAEERLLTIEGNWFFGKLQIYLTNGYNLSGPIGIRNNHFVKYGSTFSPPGLPSISLGNGSEAHSLRVMNGNPTDTLIEGNEFKGFSGSYRAVWVQNRSGVVIQDNVFTPDPGQADFTAILVGNRDVWSGISAPAAFGVTILRNTFNANGATSGNKAKAILFVDDNDPTGAAPGGALQVGDGTLANANKFDAGIGWYIALDDRTCSGNNHTGSGTCNGTSAYAIGEGIAYSGGSSASSQKRPFKWNVSAAGNSFGGVFMPDMDQAQYDAVWAKTFDNHDKIQAGAAVGNVVYDWTAPPPPPSVALMIGQDAGNDHKTGTTQAFALSAENSGGAGVVRGRIVVSRVDGGTIAQQASGTGSDATQDSLQVTTDYGPAALTRATDGKSVSLEWPPFDVPLAGGDTLPPQNVGVLFRVPGHYRVLAEIFDVATPTIVYGSSQFDYAVTQDLVITLAGANPVEYDGTVQALTFDVSPASNPGVVDLSGKVALAYNGSAAQSNAGAYAVTATAVDADYVPQLASTTFTISPAPAAVTWSALQLGYTGSMQSVMAGIVPQNTNLATVTCAVSPSSFGPQVGSYPLAATCPPQPNLAVTGSMSVTATIGGSTAVRRTHAGSTEESFFATIADALSAGDTVEGDTLEIAPGTYSGPIVLTKGVHLVGSTGYTPSRAGPQPMSAGPANPPAVTIDGGGALAVGITVANGVKNAAISGLHVLNFTQNCIAANQGNDGLQVFDNVVEHCGNRGIYVNGIAGIRNVAIHNNVVSDTGDRAISIWNGFKRDITVADNLITNAGTTGIALDDGKAAGIVITGNEIHDSGDAAITAIQLTGSGTPGDPSLANLIAGNTITNPGRFGISLMIPNGTGSDSGDGAIVVENNDITGGAGLGGYPSDRAGISVVRRYWSASQGQVDATAGVVIRSNAVGEFNLVSPGHEAYGIVVEGTGSSVYANTLDHNQFGLQIQQGNPSGVLPPGNSAVDVSDVSDWFDRGNAPLTCVSVGEGTDANTFTNNATERRDMPLGAAMTGGVVTNVNTGAHYCSITAAVAAAQDNDTISVAAGVHAENVVVTRSKVKIIGANAGMNAGVGGSRDGTGAGETILVPATAENGLGLSSFGKAVIKINADDVTLDGFVIDTDNTAIDSGVNLNGAGPDVSGGIYANGNRITLTNLVVRNAIYAGIDGGYDNGQPAQDGSVFSNNRLTNCDGTGYGVGIALEQNFYAQVTGNRLDAVRTGIQLDNNWQAAPTAGYAPTLSNNQIQAKRAGIWANLFYQNASTYHLVGNTIMAAGGGAGQWSGIWIESMQDAQTIEIASNTIDGSGADAGRMRVGYLLNNIVSSAASSTAIDGGGVSNVDVGVLATDATRYTGPVNDFVVRNVDFVSVTRGALYVEDTTQTPGSARLSIGAGNIFGSNVAHQLVLSGAAPVVSGAVDEVFVRSARDFVFGAVVSSTGNPACASNSAAPFCAVANASINAGIAAVSSGGTVNVEDGSFAENVNVNKSVTLRGPFAGIHGHDGARGTGEAVVSPATGVGVLLSAANVTVDGLTIRSGGGHAVQRNPGSAANNLRLVNNRIENVVNGSGVFSEPGATAGTGDGFEIAHNRFAGISGSGASAGRGIVLFKGTTNAQIDDNDFDGIAQYAMQLNAGNGAVSNVAVTGNRITNTASNAIVVTGASGVSFLHNTISGVPQALYFSDGTRDFTAACNVLSATGSALSAGDQFSPVRSNSNIRIFDNVLSGGTVDLNSTMAQGLTIGSNWYDGAPPAIGVSATGLLVADPLSADPTNDPHCGDNTPVSIVAYANTSPQSRPVDTAFNALRARVQDVLGGAVTGQAATFMAPGSGASASLGTSVGTTNYNGEVTTTATANSVAGSYNVTASSGALSAGFALTNTQGTATVTVASASVTYDGNPRAVTVGTTPAGLESDVQIVYTQGAATVATCAATATGCGPVNAGVYTATATIVGNDNYTGSGTGTLTIMRAPTTIEFQPDPLTFVYDGNTHMVTARLHDEPGTNCAVTGTVGPNVVGSPYAVDAAACTGANYTAPANSTTAQVTAQPMTIMLSHLTQAYDGSPKSVVVTTSPTPNVSAAVTYNGNVTPPTAEGSYNVAATVTDPNYSGSASGTLHIVGGNGDIALVLNGPVDPIHVGDTAQYAATMLANPALHAGEHYGYRVVLTKSGGSPLALSDLATMDVFYQGQWVDATQYFGAIPFTLDPVASTLTYDFPDGVPGYASGFPIEDPSWTWNFRFSFASEGTYTTTATLVQGIGGPDVDPPVMASIATVVEAALPPTDIHLVLGGPAENIEVGAPAEYTGTMLADPSLHAGEDFFVKVIVGKSGGQALVPSDIASMEIYYGGTWQPLPPGSFTQPDGAGTDLVYLFPQPAGAFPIQDAQWTWNFRITYADQGTYTATAQVIPGYQGNLANPDVLASAAISTNVVPAVVVPPTANLILLGPVEDVQAHMPAEYTGTLVADPAQFPGSYLMRVRLSRAGGTMTPADLEKMELYNGGWSDETLGIRGVMVQDGDDVLYYFPQPAASSFPITSSVWSWHFRFTYADVGEYTAVADLIDSADPSPENAASFAHAQLSTHVVAQAADIHLQLQGPVTGVVGQPAQYVGSLTADPLPAASELFYVKVRLHKSTGAMDVSDLSKMEILQGGTWYDATTELQGQFANDGNDLVYYFPQPNGAFPIDGDWSWQFRFTYADAAVYTATAQVVHESGLTPASDPVSISTDVAPEPPAVALQLNGPVAGVQVNEPAAYIGQLTNTGAALDENAYVNVDITLDGGATPLQPGDVDVEVWDGSAWVPGSLASDGNNGLTVDFPDASGFAIPANFDFTHQFRITYHVPGVFHATAAVLGADNLPQVTYATAEMFTEVVAHSPVTVQVLIDPASLHVAYDGNTHAATATTLPAVGHPLVFSYNGSTDLPSDAGIYSVVASVSPDDAPYVGSASAILLIDKAPGTITFAPLSGPFGSAHTVNASLDQDSLASCTVTGVPAANAAPGNYAISATCASNNYSAVGTATYVVTASTASIIAVGSAPVGVVAVDPQPGADAKKTSFTWKTTGSANEFVRASFVIAANGTAQAGDLALEYFETANGTWQPLPLSFSGGQWTGAFGPASGFPLVDGATSQFRATFHKGGRYTTTASLVGAGSGLVLATSASLATDVAEIGLTGIANEAGHVGQAVETAMTLSNTGTAALSSGLPAGNPIPAQPAPNDENVRGRFVITWNGGALAPADTSGPGGNCGAESCASPDVGIEYYDAATGTYRPIYNLRQSADGESLYGYFGALGNGGVPVPAAFSGSNLFHTTFKRNTGTYTVTWQVVGISTGTVYAQAPAQTIGIDTGTAASIAIVSGDGGTATVGGNAYDAGDLVVEVRDIGGNPVANAAVAFNAQPGNGGAGATFAAPAVTGVDGRTAIHALSNDFAGVFAVGASLSNGVALAQPFALENVADFDASQVRIALVSGDGQTAQVGTDYALPLLAKVTDRFGNAVAGFDVAFFVNGVGATLANDSGTTDANGLVDSGTVTASGTAGVVAVEARIDTAQCDAGSSDATCAVEFDLTNTAGGASSIALASLVNSAEVGTTGAYTLTANVHDANGNAVAGVSVTMIGPSAGAGIAPALHTVTTDTFGQATHTFDANHVAGAFQVGQGTTCLFQEQRARLGEFYLAVVAVQQHRAQFFFQRLDRQAERRLADMQAARGAAEAELFGHRDKIAELAEIHSYLVLK